MTLKIIALEEHYADAELTATFDGADATKAPAIRERLDDVGALRLKAMDQAGIALQVLSHNSPAAQNLEAARAVPMAQRVNDRLYDIVRTQPDRFAAFAALPTDDPAAAATELERTVTALQFKGAMLHGRSRGEWLDHPASGRSSSGPQCSTCRSICIRQIHTRTLSVPIMRTTHRTIPCWSAPPGATRSRRRRRRSG